MSVMSYSPRGRRNTLGVVALVIAILGGLVLAATFFAPVALYVGLALLAAALVLAIIGITRPNRPKATSIVALALSLALGLSGPLYFTVLTPTKAEAGHRYLEILCPTNAAVDAFSRALDTKDLSTIKTAARELSAAERTAAEKLTDESTRWPASVDRKDLVAMANHYYRDLAWLNSVASSDTYAGLPGARPGGDDFGEASQRIRAELDLPTDTTEGCAGLGDA